MEKRDAEYYIARGFSEELAEYYASGRKILTDVKPLKDYKLLLTYDEQEERILDISDVIEENTVFWFLHEENAFERAYIDNSHSLCWDIDPNIDSEVQWGNKVDLSPDTCYVDSVPVESDK